MMRVLTPNEKNTLKALITQGTDISFLEMMQAFWKVGILEIGAYQQILRLYITDDKEIEPVMGQITELLNLIELLESHGYLTMWNSPPTEDDLQFMGAQPDGQHQARFLPDLGVATEVLRLAGCKVHFNESIRQVLSDNGRSRAIGIHSGRLVTLGVIILIIMIAQLVLSGVRLQHQTRLNQEELYVSSTKLMDNQLKNRKEINQIQVAQDSMTVMLLGFTDDLQNLEKIHLAEKQNRLQLVDISDKQEILHQQLDSLLSRVK